MVKNLMIFQITELDLETHSTLKLEDLDKWCYLVSGCYQGFFNTEQEAITSYQEVFDN